ncbi:5458_t:CDS:2 [Entrophospora sp. SA101]|nr:5458_t:CDS:2 [Entrophospora sp. SA101]
MDPELSLYIDKAKLYSIPKSQNYFSLYCKSYIAKHKGLENSFKGSQ